MVSISSNRGWLLREMKTVYWENIESKPPILGCGCDNIREDGLQYDLEMGGQCLHPCIPVKMDIITRVGVDICPKWR